MVGETNALLSSSARGELLTISIKSNQESDYDLLGAVVRVVYSDTSTEYVWQGYDIIVEIPSSTSYNVEFGGVENYASPVAFSAVSISDNSRTIVGEYRSELVTVDITNNSNTEFYSAEITENQTIGNKDTYIKIDYIESTGAQWIDTGFVPNSNTRVIASLKNTSLNSSGWTFGSIVGLSTDQYAFSCNKSYGFRYGSENIALQESFYENIEVDFNKNAYSLNNESGAMSAQTFTCVHPMFLFAVNSSGAVSTGKFIGRMYSCKIYDNGTLVRDYIPVLRMDGVTGLYDVVNDEFVGSSGTDNFIAGNIVCNKKYTQTTPSESYKIPHGTVYSVRMGDMADNNVQNIRTFTACIPSRRVQMKYTSKITVIRIDQSITSPTGIISLVSDQGGIDAVRANSHRFTGSVVDGIMNLKQIDDVYGTKYTDGSAATLTTIGTDVWMKLPRFHWKCVTKSDDLFYFYIAYGGKPDEEYKTWDGKDLIGVYEAYSSSDKLYSVSGKTLPSSTVAAETLVPQAANRGTGFSVVKWEHHCMMAMLFYTYYRNTDSNAVCGGGTSDIKKTGGTNALGMEDTVAGGNGDSGSINFWGLENWWGNLSEFMQDLQCDQRNIYLTDENGTIRNIGTLPSSSGNISKFKFGEFIDLLPVELGATSTTGFCDGCGYTNTFGNYGVRAGGGVSSFNTKTAGMEYGSRLAYRGDYVII